jgi:hypothetical protein|tara:strand:+ start:66 stop:269 length:204 start_codon:yes stop_codon:yes gene_type:complete
MNQQQRKWIEDDIYDLIAEVKIAEKSLNELLCNIGTLLSVVHGEVDANDTLNKLIKKIEDEKTKLNK